MRSTKKQSVVRIIGGKWRNSKLAVLDQPGLRPTPDRVRETLFNWLQSMYGGHFLQMRVLDAFAGTGALGFEAASRGVQQVLMLEKNLQLYRQLDKVKQRLQANQITISNVDSLVFLANLASAQSFDLVLLDPPFQTSDYQQLISLAKPLISEAGVIYVEAAQALTDELVAPMQLQLLKYSKIGSVHAHLLVRAEQN